MQDCWTMSVFTRALDTRDGRCVNVCISVTVHVCIYITHCRQSELSHLYRLMETLDYSLLTSLIKGLLFGMYSPLH